MSPVAPSTVPATSTAHECMERDVPLRWGGSGEHEVVLRWTPGDPSRTPILYLHGLGSSQAGEKASWFRRRFVATGRGFCSLDFRGHGDSSGELVELTLRRSLEDVRRARRFLRTEGVQHILFFGSSMGALTALWAAVEDPHGVDGVLGIAPAVGLRQALLDRAGGEAGIAAWKSTGKRTLRSSQGEGELGWAFVEDLEDFPPERLAGELEVPAHFFQGRRDDSVSWRQVVALSEGCGARVGVTLFAEGDHRLIDFLDEIWADANAFLIRREARADA